MRKNSLLYNGFIFNVLRFLLEKSVKIFAKKLQKNLEVKKKSVSLQPI